MFFQKEKDLLFLKEVGEWWNTLGVIGDFKK